MSRGGSKRSRPEDEDDDNSGSSDSYGARASHRASRGAVRVRHSTKAKTTSRQHSFDDELSLIVDEDPKNVRPFDEDEVEDEDDDDDEDLDDVQSSRKRGLGPNGRITRSQNSTKRYNVPDISEDELANSSDEDDFLPMVTSDITPALRSSARKKKGRGRPSYRDYVDHDRGSSIEFEIRRSARSNRNTRSMKVPDVEDEYEVFQEKQDSGAKHVSVKEIFQPLPDDSEFERIHCETCDTCQAIANAGKGPLVYCQGCSNSFHKVCLGQRSVRDHRVTKVGPDSFVLQCRICIGTYHKKDSNAPKHAMCQTCKLDGLSCAEFSPKKTPKQEEKIRQDNGGDDPITEVNLRLINNAETVLFRCSSCKRGWHFEHLPPLSEDTTAPEDLRNERLNEYSSSGWNCKDCLETRHKIHALVAWRPLDQGSYVAGQKCTDICEDQKEYLVKWDGRSHFHDMWMPGAWVYGVSASAMRTAFQKREESMLPKMTSEEAIEEEWLLADVILHVRYKHTLTNSTKEKDLRRISDIREIFVKFQGLSYLEAVKDSPPPRDSGAPWDSFCAAYEEYVDGVYFGHVPDHKMKERIAQYRRLDFEKECELKAQPSGLKRGKLMDYQLEGVNWMLYNFHQQHNIILADEMGLGKTIQVVAFITALVQDKPNCWPFLIVVPNATCPNWRRELKQWTPDLRVVTYHGGKAAQDLAFRRELFPEGVKGGMKAHVVIMSYEAAAGDAKSAFHSVKWAGLIVDEGQRLKNERSLLYLALQDMRIPFRVLLTGTPLQNNKRELFNLLQFVDPGQNAEELDLQYAELTKENIPELHKLIKPYFLRRTKAQVLKFLPPMAQIILPVTMSLLQEKLSKSIMARNPELIRAIISRSKVKAGERKSLNNILMELRQCLCHPFCFSQDVEDRRVTDALQIQRNLVEASGKLLLLSVMLPKLMERGHRVLIFSQFLHCLTIIEDFLAGLGLPHSRIDGSLSALEKQKRIDAFNAPNSPLFAMLLSTRAGGVGINLATADTVIIYDPDFNPHQDIQALSRAHRIGQKNKVLCFQLMTKNTVEEKIMQIGRKKMALDHALIETMDHEDEAGNDLESILKHGAEALFADDAQDKISYDEASVEKLLERSEIENTDAGDDGSAEAQFSFARVWANNEGTLTTSIDAEASNGTATPDHGWESAWEKILKEREEEHQRELAAQQQVYGRGTRRRVTQVRREQRAMFVCGLSLTHEARTFVTIE
jgi:chromodomain-helicase-DNA-binding protein 4